MKHSLGIMVLAVVVGVLAVGRLAQANMLTNGNFEDTSGTFPNGWLVSGGVAGQESTTAQNLVISGSESLRVSGGVGNVTQTIATDLADFTLSFDWLRPFASIPANRTMNLHLRDGTATPFINMRVEPVNGDTELALQVFDGGWTDLDPAGAATQLILETETAYTITITASGFGAAGATYDLSVVGGSVNESFTAVDLYQNDPFSAGELVNTVRFDRQGSHGSSTFDNVTLTPEPASLALLGLGGLAVLRRRG